MNKKRLLKLLEIFRRRSDMDHRLSLNEIVSLLEEEGITVANRKTLYDDIKELSETVGEIEYNNGYYLNEAPFSLSEIKIIIDSLNSLKNLDEKFLNDLKEKLYAFISVYESDFLKQLEYCGKHTDKRFLNRLEDSLYAIRNGKTLQVKRKNKDEEEISPVFLYRQNDYYYLYYHYPDKDKIYHMRFDNIVSTRLSECPNSLSIPKNRIIDHIRESTNAFYSGKTQTVKAEIVTDSESLRNRLQDDFPNIVFTKTGFSLKASISDVFFSKLAAYGDQIKISDRNIADPYIAYLNKIVIRNSRENRNS
ncbi:MAG: WYL domain-containing protein [Erysipelotrichaceae bacterium]|nr:WYL domain-containing protein [Erysipelotrichaceae bacterium]